MVFILLAVWGVLFTLFRNAWTFSVKERFRVRVELTLSVVFYKLALERFGKQRFGGKTEEGGSGSAGDGRATGTGSGTTTELADKTTSEQDLDQIHSAAQFQNVIGQNLTDLSRWMVEMIVCLAVPITAPLGVWEVSRQLEHGLSSFNLALLIFGCFQAVWLLCDFWLFFIKKGMIVARNVFADRVLVFVGSASGMQTFQNWAGLYLVKRIWPARLALTGARKLYYGVYFLFTTLDGPMPKAVFLGLCCRVGKGDWAKAAALQAQMDLLTSDCLGKIEEFVYYSVKYFPTHKTVVDFYEKSLAPVEGGPGGSSSSVGGGGGGGISTTAADDDALLQIRGGTTLTFSASGSTGARLTFPAPFELLPADVCLLEAGTGEGKSMACLGLLQELQELSTAGARGSDRDVSAVYVPGDVAIGFAGDTPYMMSRSIRDNILFGVDFDADVYSATLALAQLEELCQSDNSSGASSPAGAAAIVPSNSLADGAAPTVNLLSDDLVLSGNGQNVSGGQRQRISMARAIYNVLYRTSVEGKRAFLVFDNPCSGLDGVTAKGFFEDLMGYFSWKNLPVAVFVTVPAVAGGREGTGDAKYALLRASSTKRYGLEHVNGAVELRPLEENGAAVSSADPPSPAQTTTTMSERFETAYTSALQRYGDEDPSPKSCKSAASCESLLAERSSSQYSADASRKSTWTTFGRLISLMGCPLLVALIATSFVEAFLIQSVDLWVAYFSQIMELYDSIDKDAGDVAANFEGNFLHDLKDNAFYLLFPVKREDFFVGGAGTSAAPLPVATFDADRHDWRSKMLTGWFFIIIIFFAVGVVRLIIQVWMSARAANKWSFGFLRSLTIVKGYSFFSTVPAGRISNRVSQDLAAIGDENLFDDPGPPSVITKVFKALILPVLLFPLLSKMSEWRLIVPVTFGGLFILGICSINLLSRFRAAIKEIVLLLQLQKSFVWDSFRDATEGAVLLRCWRRSLDNNKHDDTPDHDASNSLSTTQLALSELRTLNRIQQTQVALQCWLLFRLDFLIQTVIQIIKAIAKFSAGVDLMFMNNAFEQVSLLTNPAKKGIVVTFDQVAVFWERVFEWTDPESAEIVSRGNKAMERELESLAVGSGGKSRKGGVGTTPLGKPVEPRSTLLAVENISGPKSWTADKNDNLDRVVVLKDLSLKIIRGERILLVGRTGSGKSTLFNALLRQVGLEDGQIVLRTGDGRPMLLNAPGLIMDEESKSSGKPSKGGLRRRKNASTATAPVQASENLPLLLTEDDDADLESGTTSLAVLPPAALRSALFAVFPQTPFVLPGSFFLNLDLSGKLSKSGVLFPILKQTFGKFAAEKISGDNFGQAHVVSVFFSQISDAQLYRFFDGQHPSSTDVSALLSPAQQQLLHLCRVRAQSQQPEVLLLDEITAQLSSGEAEAVMQTVLEIYADKTIVCISHQTELAVFGRDFDRKIEMGAGRVVAEERLGRQVE